MKTATAATTAAEKIIEFFKENENIFNTCIEELDSYNGYLGDDRYYYMEDLKEFYHGADPVDILYRAFYGRDDDTWHTDAHGEKIYGPFNPNRDYFYYNGYGNLISSNYKDYTGHLDVYVVEAMNDARAWIDTIDENDELLNLFDEFEKEAAENDI